MSKSSGNIIDYTGGGARVCRVAYVIGNDQPVRCSYISDQPLFYMDYEGDIDAEEEMHDPFGTDLIESKILELQEKIAECDRMLDEEAAFLMPPDAAMMEDIALVTKPAAPQIATEDPALLTGALKKSRLAAAFLTALEPHGTRIFYTRQTEDAHYDRKSGMIEINPALPRGERILLAVRELRRAWQHRAGVLIHPLTFHPDQAVLVNRAQIADLAAIMVRVAWELQLAGEKDAWDRIETSPMADLGRAFVRESYTDFRTLNNGAACCAAFEAWFLSGRCKHEDGKLIQQMLADYQGYVFDTEQSSRQITAEFISGLGSMPFGKNYLAGHVATIMADPVFNELRDRSNANFLWFIKFERSFRETEQELQTSAPAGKKTGSRDDRPGSSPDKNNNRLGNNEERPQIIALARGRDKDGASGGADIIAFNPRQSGG